MPYVLCRRCGSKIPAGRPRGITSLEGNISVKGNVRVDEGGISFGEGGSISFGPGGAIGLGGPPSVVTLSCLRCGHTARYNLDDIKED